MTQIMAKNNPQNKVPFILTLIYPAKHPFRNEEDEIFSQVIIVHVLQ